MTDPNTAPAVLRDRTFLQALFDLAIPASQDGRLPAAGSLELADSVATGAEGDAMLGPLVQTGLEAVRRAALEVNPGGFPALAPEAQLDVLQSQLSAHPMLMFALARFLYPAYYGHPRVLEGLGEPPRPPFPEGFEVEVTDPKLLELLRARAQR